MLSGLLTFSEAIKLSGHCAGENPPALAGSQVQLSCGENETAIVHD
jgi:hypothetical protein